MTRRGLVLALCLGLLVVVLGAVSAADTTCPTVCYVDDDGLDTNSGNSPAEAFKTIQKGIDTVAAGGEVRVLPGSYNETTSGRYLFNNTGPYQFGLFVKDNDKDGISILGVTAGDEVITDPNLTQAMVETNATNSFGYSGIFVEADNVTIAGLEIGRNYPDDNKTIEVIGDNFTLKDSFLNVIEGASPYINDWRYDEVNNISYVRSYTIANNLFSPGGIISISSGAGYTGDVSGRQIINNEFSMEPSQTWPNISFNGDTTTVGWFKYPVGGAIITGNSFENSATGGLHIRLRGVANDTGFNWESIWNDNSYNKAVMVGQNPPYDVRSWTYTSGSYTFNDVRVIGTDIQPEINRGLTDDTVLVKAGTYIEQVVVNKSLDLVGDGPATTIIKAPGTIPAASNADSTVVKIAGADVSVNMSGFTVTGPGPTGCGSLGSGIFVRDGAHANITGNHVLDIRDQGTSGCQSGLGIMVGRQSLSTTGTATIVGNVVAGYQKNGITVSGLGSMATIKNNSVTGAGPITYIAQNGIQVSGGATANILGNTVSGHSYTPFTWVSTGLLLWGPAEISTEGNEISENQVGIYIYDADGEHANNKINATASGTGSPGFWGMVVDSPPPFHIPSPYEDEPLNSEMARSTASKSTTSAVQTVVLTGNEIVSDGSSGGVGLETDAGYGALDIDLTATYNLIHDWDYGVYVYECQGSTSCTGSSFARVDFHRNSIAGNVSSGMISDTITPVVNATCNWWGSASGPGSVASGMGDLISAYIEYLPWLKSNDLVNDPCLGGFYDFEGFFSPVNNDMLNLVKGGQTVPLKWRLTLNGVPVDDPGSFVKVSVQRVTCDTGDLEGDAVEGELTGGSGLTYQGDGNWQYNWKTLKVRHIMCYDVSVIFNDGTTSPAVKFQIR